jgi:hypothetical protein
VCVPEREFVQHSERAVKAGLLLVLDHQRRVGGRRVLIQL